MLRYPWKTVSMYISVQVSIYGDNSHRHRSGFCCSFRYIVSWWAGSYVVCDRREGHLQHCITYGSQPCLHVSLLQCSPLKFLHQTSESSCSLGRAAGWQNRLLSSVKPLEFLDQGNLLRWWWLWWSCRPLLCVCVCVVCGVEWGWWGWGGGGGCSGQSSYWGFIVAFWVSLELLSSSTPMVINLPVGTRHNDSVIMTSKRHSNVVLTP